jgi:hypothetical protein
MTPVYSAAGQLIKVRFVLLLALCCAVGGLLWGWNLLQTYGLAPGDGGVLAPFWQRAAWGSSVALLGLAFGLGMWLYVRQYIARIDYDESSASFHIRTADFLSVRPFVASKGGARRGKQHAGQLNLPDAPSVHAPWTSIRVPGRRLPLILDDQGSVHNAALLQQLTRRRTQG